MTLATLAEKDIRLFIKENELSEKQAQRLIRQENDGRARKIVLKMLGAQVRKAERKRTLKQVQDEGILLPTVWNYL